MAFLRGGGIPALGGGCNHKQSVREDAGETADVKLSQCTRKALQKRGCDAT